MWITPDPLAAELGAVRKKRPAAAKNQLLRLGGLVVRVSRRQPFFLIVTPEHRVFGGPPIEWWLDDYFRWLGHPYYLALHSAAGTYGANPQALQVTQVMTDNPRREIQVGRVRVQFFVKRRIEQTPTQMLANAHAPLHVSTPEATAFDLVRYAPRLGGIGPAIEILAPLLPLLRAPELKRLMAIEHEPATAQRLGYLIEQAGHGRMAEVIHRGLPSRPPVVSLVSAAADQEIGPLVERWRLRENSGEYRP